MSEIEAVTAIIPLVVNCCKSSRRGGRVAECGGLLISLKPLLDAAFQRLTVWPTECVD